MNELNSINESSDEHDALWYRLEIIHQKTMRKLTPEYIATCVARDNELFRRSAFMPEKSFRNILLEKFGFYKPKP